MAVSCQSNVIQVTKYSTTPALSPTAQLLGLGQWRTLPANVSQKRIIP